MRNPSAPTNSNIRTPCCTKVGLKRGPWTPEEDELLASYITKEGEGRWRTLPKRAGLLRCGKSCRLRWMNYLRPCVKRGHIAPDEEDLILRLHRLLGNRWSLIAGRIPGRTDNEIKNYWNTHLSKKLISQGIDPRTHKPLTPSDNQLPAVNPNPSSNQNPNPNPNPNLNLEEDGSHEHGHAHCTQEGVFKKFESGTSNLDNERNTHNRVDMDNLQNGFQAGSSHGNSEQEDDMDYCSDDIFSSFLNSLINDDIVVPQQHQHKHQASGEPHISGSSFGYGAFWDPTISSTPAANNDVENDRDFVGNASKRL